jgi:hypothetical protein
MTPAQINAVQLVAMMITDTVREAGPLGAPSGPMFAALSAQGCTLNQYQSIMSALVRAGKLTQDGNVYHIALRGPQQAGG